MGERNEFGKTLIIANPAAQMGNSAEDAGRIEKLLKLYMLGSTFERVETERAGHATEIASKSSDFDTLIVMGGDGAVNEVVNGLMKLPRKKRPALAVAPMGSGNDYGRTLRMSAAPARLVERFAVASKIRADLGCCNGHYYAETLSFGLDAAIALDTVSRRERTGGKGLSLYAASSMDQLLHHLEEYSYTISLDGGEPLEGDMILCAVQNGPYYGSGFKICPDARITDGLLDICIAHPPISKPMAAMLFGFAKFGAHTWNKQLEMHKARKIELSFDRRPPVQIDGEELLADSYTIHVEEGAIDVYSMG